VPTNVVQNTLTAQFNNIAQVKAVFEKYPTEIAVVILEPVVGNSGLILPKPGFLQELREITTLYGALLMFDEVMTGFRVHLGGAQALYGIKPDMMALGKVIGGGLPVAAYGGRRDIMAKVAPLGPVYQAGTLSGNPVGMAAGLATLEEWTKPGVFERAAKVASTVVQALRENSKAVGIPLVAESVGTMFGFFFQSGPIESYDDAKRSDVEQFKRFFHQMLGRGVYFAPSQFEAAFVSVTHEGAPVDFTVKAIQGAFEALRAR
jgi:glutamate-1-semialdehyde 2,1-aminomutase